MHLVRQRQVAASGGAADAVGASISVLFLTPCHATPYSTHVHLGPSLPPLPMRFLDCSPPEYAAATARLNRASQAWLWLPEGECEGAPAGLALSQRQCFERGPAAYLQRVLEGNAAAPPRLLVGYAALMGGRLGGTLRRWGYRLHSSLTNCWVQTDEDSPCQLQLWELATDMAGGRREPEM